MGVLNWFKKDEKNEEKHVPPSAAEPVVPPELEAIIETFRRLTAIPTVKLKASRGKTTPYSSKLGGTPYLPPGFEYPRSKNPHSGQRLLRLLAQLNFAELPKLPDFPTDGILQIYAEPDDLYGADFDCPTDQIGFRVVYHERVEIDAALLGTPPPVELDEEDLFPFEGEFVLTAELSEMAMSTVDYRFDNAFLEVYRRYLPTDAKCVWDLDESQYKVISEAFSATGHHMGGYPFFTQQDPRDYDDKLSKYTTLLLQIDSEGHGKDEIIWGDLGVAGFFITLEQLRKRDFSEVLYNWDCS